MDLTKLDSFNCQLKIACVHKFLCASKSIHFSFSSISFFLVFKKKIYFIFLKIRNYKVTTKSKCIQYSNQECGLQRFF
jgi:hypothetical protein